MAPLDPGSEHEEDLGPSGRNCISPLEHLENPGGWGGCCSRPFWHWGKWSTEWGGTCLQESRRGSAADRQRWWETRNSSPPTWSRENTENWVEGSSGDVYAVAHEEAAPPSSHKEHLAWADLTRGWGRVCLLGTTICLGMCSPDFWKPWPVDFDLYFSLWICILCFVDSVSGLWLMDFLLQTLHLVCELRLSSCLEAWFGNHWT